MAEKKCNGYTNGINAHSNGYSNGVNGVNGYINGYSNGVNVYSNFYIWRSVQKIYLALISVFRKWHIEVSNLFHQVLFPVPIDYKHLQVRSLEFLLKLDHMQQYFRSTVF